MSYGTLFDIKIGYGPETWIGIETDPAAKIGSVVIMAPSAVTHSFNTHQRLVGLVFAHDKRSSQIRARVSGTLS